MMPTLFDRNVKTLDSIHELAPNGFIFERHGALSLQFCDELIRRFEQDERYHKAGAIGQLGFFDQSVKKTTDLVVSDKKDWKDIDQIFFQSLAATLDEFRQRFEYFKGPFKDMGYQVQRYLPGDYYHWHIDGGNYQFANRQLVALWYLNDVAESAGGQTEFLFQGIRVKPEKGKLILFPPFWTHEHRAAVLKEGVKYIATTWILFRDS